MQKYDIIIFAIPTNHLDSRRTFYQNLSKKLSETGKEVLIFRETNSKSQILNSKLILADLEMINDEYREYIIFSERNKKYKIGFYRENKYNNLEGLFQESLIIPNYNNGIELISERVKKFYESYDSNKISICPDADYSTYDIFKITKFSPKIVSRWIDLGYIKGERVKVLNKKRNVKGEDLIKFLNDNEMINYLDSKLYTIEELSRISKIPDKSLFKQFDYGKLK